MKTKAIFVLILLSMQASRTLAQEKTGCCLRDVFQCNPPVWGAPQGVVYLRSLPFLNARRIEVPIFGRNIIDVIAGQEAISVSINQVLNKKGKTDVSNSRNAFYFSKTTPNAILLSSGNQVTVFPRALLLHTAVRRSLLIPNDLVATFELSSTSAQRDEDSSEVVKIRNRDPVHNWYYSNVAKKRAQGSASIRLAGALAPQRLKGERLFSPPFKWTDLGILLSSKLAVGGLDYKAELKFSEQESLPIVIVLRRQVGLITFRQIAPLSNGGVFAQDSPIFHTVFGTENPVEKEDWDAMFDDFLRIPLIDGDVIEITSLAVLPPFSRLRF